MSGNLTAVLEQEDGHRHNEIVRMIELRYEEENITDNSLSIHISGRRTSFNRTLESIDCRVVSISVKVTVDCLYLVLFPE